MRYFASINMNRAYYSNTIVHFLNQSTAEIIGFLAGNGEFASEVSQIEAWRIQIERLKVALKKYDGFIAFEYIVPRMGRRIDVLLVIKHVIFILEFKVGETDFTSHAIDQVWDYALDLKNFHETSHDRIIVPILVATKASTTPPLFIESSHNDQVLVPIKSDIKQLPDIIDHVLAFESGDEIDTDVWTKGRYAPTPTIIEAAMALYSQHSVLEISRSDASAKNLARTSKSISEIINTSKKSKLKSICFVTGVPGAGKTLVGLDIATKYLDKKGDTSGVFLSGNGPLVEILCEALARDEIKRSKARGEKIKKGDALRKVKVFIQNIHHYRDNCLTEKDNPPHDHVAIFDEAQRAWNHAQTASFMQRKKNEPNFAFSEPEFLISCLDRHKDWAVIVCLIGGGQEINTGEAGISEWIESLNRSFPEWNIHISSHITDTEYAAGEALKLLDQNKNVAFNNDLHLSVSMRSFRAENLSLLVKNLLDRNISEAKFIYEQLKVKYPLVITRNLSTAKQWLKQKARGSERYGLVVSSQAQRLKPLAIDVKSPMDPVHWFLDPKSDVRSSYYLEDVATEFHVQGLELDWSCVTWDADFRYSNDGWGTFSFVGDKWQRILKEERKLYLKNAYRVLLTRARQGMVIVVPEGDPLDPTRSPEYYDTTFKYLEQIGITVI